MKLEQVPVFDNWEELNSFLTKASTGKQKRTRSKKKPVTDEAVNLTSAQNTEAKEVYQTIHYYVREKDTWQTVLVDAKEEVKFRNESVLVFAHNHQLGEVCTNLCRAVVK